MGAITVIVIILTKQEVILGDAVVRLSKDFLNGKKSIRNLS